MQEDGSQALHSLTLIQLVDEFQLVGRLASPKVIILLCSIN